MAISDLIPNIFGSTPEAYRGLLTPEQSAGLEKRANIGGLLGSISTLAQGMSAQGAPRSPLQNILTSIAAGYGAAGQTYESGINQLSSLQKLQQSQAQIEAINQLARDPAVASDPAMMAYLRANPAEAIKYLAETRQFQRAREAAMPTTPAPAPAAAPATPAIDAMGVRPEDLPPFSGKEEVYRVPMPNEEPPKPAAPVPVARNPEIARLDTQIQQGLADASVYSNLRRPQDAEATLRNVDRLRERQQQLIASEIDIDQRIANAPASYKDQYVTLKSIKETLKPKDFIDALQKIDTAVVESGKQFKFDGAAGNFAVYMFKTNDMTKLTPEQNALVLRYQNAPTEADQKKIVIDAQRLLEETGARVAIPVSRESLIGGGVPAPVASSASVPAAPVVATTVPSAPTAPRVSPRPATTSEATQVVKEINKPLVTPRETPLINKPDTQVTPKTKKELLVKQPSTIALANYALKNVVDARDSAQKLLDNPAYIDSLTGVTAPAMKNIPGTDAFTANQLMQNLLGRAFVNELSQMRNASPTGGAVGNVAVTEMDTLSKIQSSLTVGMKKDEFVKQLKQYINVSDRAIKGIPKEYANTYGYNGEFDELLRGTVVEKPEAPALPQGVKVKRVR